MLLHGKLKGRGVILDDEPTDVPEGTAVEVVVQVGAPREPSGLCGIWNDERSAREIVRELREARTGYGGRTPPL